MSVKALFDSNLDLYGAVARMGHGMAVCCTPDELARYLADELGMFLQFDHLDVMALKENSSEIEWLAWGKGPLPQASSLLHEGVPAWHLLNTQEPLYIADWERDERFPQLKQMVATWGAPLASVLRIPLRTSRRRIGTFGIANRQPAAYSAEEITFLWLTARVVAFTIESELNPQSAASSSGT